MKNKNNNLVVNVKIDLNDKEYIIKEIEPKEIIDYEVETQDNNMEFKIKKVKCECIIKVIDKKVFRCLTNT